MEKLHKDILIHLRKNIIDDLDVDNDVIQPLRNEYIITEDHIKNIYIGATKEERAAKLLDILPLYAYLYIYIFIYISCYIRTYIMQKLTFFYFNVIAFTNNSSSCIS